MVVVVFKLDLFFDGPASSENRFTANSTIIHPLCFEIQPTQENKRTELDVDIIRLRV